MTKSLDDLTSSDFFDSRYVIERLDELQADFDDEETTLDDEEIVELDALREFAEEAAGYVPDWQYGETFIRDDYFTEYAEQLADDIGAIDANASWPLNHINWEAAADELKQDYMSFSLGGHEWWAR